MTPATQEATIINWNDGLRIGVASIDGENHRLARLINRLYAMMLAGRGSEYLPTVLHHLKTRSAHQIADEETVLKGHAYPGLDKQQYQHEELRSKVEEWDRACRAGELVLPADVLIYLKEWWRDHVLGTDREYVPFMEQWGVAPSMRAARVN